MTRKEECSPDPVRQYQQAWKELQQAREEFERIYSFIDCVGGAIDEARCEIHRAVPPAMKHFRQLTPAEQGRWPTLPEIVAAVASWTSAFHRLVQAWEAVPVSRRDGLKSPDDLRSDP
jgi:hypothetical protein